MSKKKVIIGMSGGVDSAVSAWLLLKKGYNVEAVFMKNWEENKSENCNIKKDFIDAKKICNQLKIKLYKINFSYEYWNHVFVKFIKEYKKGYTPNPDILCNQKIKFKVFLNFAIKNLKADYIATGHYVRLKKIGNKLFLLKGIDQNKDQSYFLYKLKYNQIKKCIFPLGNLYKKEVRHIAKKIKLINAYKKDSTGICFIGEKNFSNFINKYIKSKPGKIKTTKNKTIGIHKGIIHYTIGQRKKLGIGGIKNKNNKPWYVVDKIIKKNLLIVSQGKKNKYLMSNGLIATNIHWINYKKINFNLNCSAKTRYRQKEIPCKIIPKKNNYIEVYFSHLVDSITPGQSIVFYFNKICLGGGIIKNKIKN